MRRDAEKLKFFSFAASLKKREGGEHSKKDAFHIWFAASERQEKRDKCESTLRIGFHFNYLPPCDLAPSTPLVVINVARGFELH